MPFLIEKQHTENLTKNSHIYIVSIKGTGMYNKFIHTTFTSLHPCNYHKMDFIVI